MTQDFYVVAAGRRMPPGGAAEVGNKGWNLMRMAQIGLPVPPAVILPTGLCARLAAGDADGLDELIGAALRELEQLSQKSFGGQRRPLLLSVRSGAQASMPGMMETVLNVGVNDDTVTALIRATGCPSLAWDCYRRLILSYGEVVAQLKMAPFAETTARLLAEQQESDIGSLAFEGLRQLVQELLGRYRMVADSAFPQDVQQQLRRSVRAVFASWHSDKAVSFRRLNHLEDLTGTAVTLQAMVFGNMGAFSGSGVGFTRDPADGEDRLYLDFVFNGQGEDIVAGRQGVAPAEKLAAVLPDVWQQLLGLRHQLEAHFGDAQDFEFTVEEGHLWLLQTRNAKRTSWAALKIALDLFQQGVISAAAALALLQTVDVDAIERRRISNAETVARLGGAVIASPGVAGGRAAFDLASAQRLAATGDPVILIRRDSATQDIEAIQLAVGILTAGGGRTSHAAVVARQMNKVCLVNCPDLQIAEDAAAATLDQHAIAAGDWLTLDGNDGSVYAGLAQFTAEKPRAELARLAALQAGNLSGSQSTGDKLAEGAVQ